MCFNYVLVYHGMSSILPRWLKYNDTDSGSIETAVGGSMREGGDGPSFGPGDGVRGEEVSGERLARAAKARARAAIAEGVIPAGSAIRLDHSQLGFRL